MAKNIIKFKRIKLKTLLLVAFLVLVIFWLDLFNYIGTKSNGVKNLVPERREARAASLEIKTDKNIYAPGETVKIRFLNLTRSKLQESPSATVSISARSYLGENYGVGLIEQFTDGRWLAAEPVWRCDESCYNPCGAARLISGGEQKEFFWKQTILKCNGFNKADELETAVPGRYRVSTAVWDSTLESYKIVSSNEFEIK